MADPTQAEIDLCCADIVSRIDRVSDYITDEMQAAIDLVWGDIGVPVNTPNGDSLDNLRTLGFDLVATGNSISYTVGTNVTTIPVVLTKDDRLAVLLNGVRLQLSLDYTVSIVSDTQVTLVLNLEAGDVLLIKTYPL